MILVFTLGDVVLNNWLWTDHRQIEGEISVVRAIARSNDTFTILAIAWELIKSLSFPKLWTRSKNWDRTNWGNSGLVPTRAWKEENFDQIWFRVKQSTILSDKAIFW